MNGGLFFLGILLGCVFIVGAAAANPTIVSDFRNLKLNTLQGYGLTETSPVLTAENEKCIRYGSIGFPMANVEIKIDGEKVGKLIVPSISKEFSSEF